MRVNTMAKLHFRHLYYHGRRCKAFTCWLAVFSKYRWIRRSGRESRIPGHRLPRYLGRLGDNKSIYLEHRLEFFNQ